MIMLLLIVPFISIYEYHGYDDSYGQHDYVDFLSITIRVVMNIFTFDITNPRSDVCTSARGVSLPV